MQNLHDPLLVLEYTRGAFFRTSRSDDHIAEVLATVLNNFNASSTNLVYTEPLDEKSIMLLKDGSSPVWKYWTWSPLLIP